MRRKSVLAGLLCLAMVLSMVPMEVFAAEDLLEDTAVLEALSEDIVVSEEAIDVDEGEAEET